MANPKGKQKVRAFQGVRDYFGATRSPLVAFAVTLPLLLLYNAGLLMPGADEMNAADLLTGLVVRLAGPKGFLAVNGVLVLTSVVLTLVLFRRGRFRPLQWLVLGLEGLALGVALGYAVVSMIEQAHVLAAGQGPRYSVMQALSLAAGAGYWEELVFRLGLVGGPIAVARRLHRSASTPHSASARVRVAAVGALAVVVSSFLFSLAHYVGSESFVPYTFWYRALSGVLFALIFLVRGFAVAAYTHFLYDVVVML